ncbi:MAG: bifunctional 2-polyprenyl-6-hydroxyphenol methylase/3-demethylubiquinol 3-O-methyltransferase UbiG [bacterium]
MIKTTEQWRQKMGNNLGLYDLMGDFWWSTDNSLYYLNQTRFMYFNGIIGNFKALKVLDIGCGGGLLSEEFAKKGADVTGIDISENSINVARDHALKNNLNIDYKVCSAENLPFNTEMFDIVACVDCLEHVSDLEKVISEISRVLKINGKFLYLTQNRTLISKIVMIWILERFFRLKMRQQFKTSKMQIENLDTHNWNKFIKPEELYNLIYKYGMKNTETKGIEFGGIKKGNIRFRIGKNVRVAYTGYAQK